MGVSQELRARWADARGSRAPAARTRTWSSWPAAENLEHLRDVERMLLQRRRQSSMYTSAHRLSAEGVSVDPRIVQSIVEWATPISCCEVLRFTGLANYYRRFVEGYAEVAAPLSRC